MIEKKKRHGRKQRRVEQDDEPVQKKRHGRRQRRAEDLDELIEVFERANLDEKSMDEIDDVVQIFERSNLTDKQKREILNELYQDEELVEIVPQLAAAVGGEVVN